MPLKVNPVDCGVEVAGAVAAGINTTNLPPLTVERVVKLIVCLEVCFK